MGEQHLGGTPEGSSLIAHVGDRVMTKEGFPGVVTDTHEGLGPDSTYWVTLDNGMGGGEYGESEISPINSRDAAVERTAADDYPELGTILHDRLPIQHTVPASEYFGGRVLSSKTATPDEASDWDDAGAHEDMDGEEYLDPPYPEDEALAAQGAGGKCKCCGGAGEHDDGHECYVCDASGQESEAKGEVCEGHHGRPDHSELSAERGVHHEGAAKVHCADCGDDYFVDNQAEIDAHHASHKTAAQNDDVEVRGGYARPYTGSTRMEGYWLAVRPDGTVVTGEMGRRYFGSPKEVEKFFATSKQADLYLPLDEKPSTTMVPRALDEGEEPGFQDGWLDATTSAVKSPKSEDPMYRSGYALGWAEGLKAVAPTKPGPEPEADLEQRLSTVDLGMPGLRTTAGLFDFITGDPKPSKTWAGPGNNWSFDWCRFRRNSHCYYPKHLDEAATRQAGYAVWIPEDRGNCPRVKWDDQKVCPVSEPGPHVPGGFTDATVPWGQGGQHGGTPDPAWTKPSETFSPMSASKTASLDIESAFHFISTWADVRNKAKKIRSSGGVRILAVREGQITGQIQGDTNVYQATLTSVPGKYAVAYWECGCAWAAYAWGRSPAYARFEGRMCSHALALNYEAQARSMFGKTITEDAKTPSWMDTTIPVKVPGDYDRNKGRHSSLLTLHRVDAAYLNENYDEPAPLALMREAAASRGFAAKVRSVIKMLFVQPQGIADENGVLVPVADVYYPTYDPHRGLSLMDRIGILADEWALTTEAAQEWKVDCKMCGQEGAPVLGGSGHLECRYCGSANVRRTAHIDPTEQYAEHIHHVLMPDGKRYPYDHPWYDRSRWGRNGPEDPDHELDKVRHMSVSDDEFGLLLPGEPSYDMEPVVWAGPNGVQHGGDLLGDSLVPDEPEEALPVTYGDDDEAAALASVKAALATEHVHKPFASDEGGPVFCGDCQAPLRSASGRYYTIEELREVGRKAAEAAGMTAAQVLENEASFFHPHPVQPRRRVLSPEEMREEQKRIADEAAQDPEELLRQHRARLAAGAIGQQVDTPDPFAYLKAGDASPDVAARAQEFLAKQGMGTFSPAERAQIIDEGIDGEGASNLASLDISGTHYEALERRRASEPDDDDSLFWG